MKGQKTSGAKFCYVCNETSPSTMKRTMIRKPLYILLFYVCGLFTCMSCTQHSSRNKVRLTATDTLKWHLEKIHKEDPDCDTALTKDCTIIDLRYHVFEGYPELNDSIRKAMTGFLFTERQDTSLSEQTDKFYKDYESFKKEPYSNGRHYQLQGETRILRQTHRLIALEVTGYSYTGGAHGMGLTSYINYDPIAKKIVRLNDVLQDHYEPALTKTAEKIFRKNEGLPPNTPLPPDTYFFKDNQFHLNENYTFTKDGIQFLYNPYEIKPYAAGQTRLLVPYSQLPMRPDQAY